jgi:V/A-type H+-transporting ATPase subunit I
MSKVTVACVAQERTATLQALRDLGCLHLVPLAAPKGEALAKARATLSYAEKALEALPKAQKTPAAAPTSAPSGNLLQQIHAAQDAKKSAEELLKSASAELARLAPFGSFDPAGIEALAKAGIELKLYQAPEKAYQAAAGDLAAAGDFAVKEYGKQDGQVYFAVVGKELPALPSAALPCVEVALPQKSILALTCDAKDAASAIQKSDAQLQTLAQERDAVQRRVTEALGTYEFESASAGMMEAESIALVQGWCPESQVAALRSQAPAMGWGLDIEAPAPEEAVPTKLTHARWVKPIDALYSVIGITPGYREIDISAVFLCFFTIFFAMIVGDMGYGLIVLAVTLFARKKMPDAPAYVFQFLYLMSGATILWGILGGSFFGLVKPDLADPARAHGFPMLPDFLNLQSYFTVHSPIYNAIDWIRVDANVQYLCFIIAVIHLTIARLWNAGVQFGRKNFGVGVNQLGWTCTTWTMFFLACSMILPGKTFPFVAWVLGGVGVVLILAGAVMQKEWFSCGMLPLNLVSNLVDVISYIRLFAVGLAGYAVANAFNGMVAGLVGTVPGILAAAVVIVLVTLLNLALAGMGVAVHAVRLNTLEFSGAVGVEWSGNPYTPFRKK